MSTPKTRDIPIGVHITQVLITVSPDGRIVVDLELLWRLNGFPVPQSTKQLPLTKEDEKKVKALLEDYGEIVYNSILRKSPGAQRSE